MDAATGSVLDWNVSAAKLCGWRKGAARHSFDELAQLLTIEGAAELKRVTFAQIARLAAARKGRQLSARLRTPGGGTNHLVLEALTTGGRHRDRLLLLFATLRQVGEPEDSGAGPLSASVGHELNNIAVPLDGFTELAFQSSAANEPVRQFLDEIRIAVDRIKTLAYDLQSLGESEARPARVPLGECVSEATGSPADICKIDWHCSATDEICVDRLHAQRAIRSLARFATAVGAKSPAGSVLSVSHESPVGARCISCGAAVRKDNYVVIQARNSRPVSGEEVRNPFGSTGLGRPARRLTLAVLVHCAHRAGGHILLDQGSGSLSVAFPQA